MVEKDPSGNITSYEITEEVSLSEGHTTEYVPFRGTDWILHIKCRIASSNVRYATILHALDVVQGTTSDYEGFIVRFEGASSVTMFPRLVIGTKKYLLQDVDSILDMTFTYSGKVITAVNNGRQIYQGGMNISRKDIQVWIGSDSGGGNKCVVDILEFSVKDV